MHVKVLWEKSLITEFDVMDSNHVIPQNIPFSQRHSGLESCTHSSACWLSLQNDRQFQIIGNEYDANLKHLKNEKLTPIIIKVYHENINLPISNTDST